MGVIKQGILGGFRGRVANVVGTSWKGIAVIKGMPLSVANPRTAGQISNRNSFGSVVAFATAILATIIKPLLDRVAVQMSGYNLFVQMNKQYFVNGTINTPSAIQISKGTVTPAENLTCVADVSLDSIVFTWTDNSGVGDSLATDEIYICVYNSNQDEFLTSPGAAIRSAGTYSTNVPAGWVAGNALYIYTAFRRADGTRSSNTVYVQSAIIA